MTDTPTAVAQGRPFVNIDAARAKRCHYCKIRVATTRDHVVALSLIDLEVRQQLRNHTVPCCDACNISKDAWRIIDHECRWCDTAWVLWGPAGWARQVPTVTMFQVTARARQIVALEAEWRETA